MRIQSPACHRAWPITFGPYRLDAAVCRLSRDGEPVALPDRYATILLLLVAKAGTIVPKEALLDAGWKDVAVGDNSLEQAISSLRRALGPAPDGEPYIETLARRGYRFHAAVTRVTPRADDAALDALLAPHRAFTEGRTALETFDRDAVAGAQRVFERIVAATPDYGSAHVGLANAYRCGSSPHGPNWPRIARRWPRPSITPAKPAVSIPRPGRRGPRSGPSWRRLG